MTTQPANGTAPLGIDVGGTGIKGAAVDLNAGEFATDRLRIPTPRPATPDAVCGTIEELATHFEPQCGAGPIGISIPGQVKHGVVQLAVNLSPEWTGFDLQGALSKRLGRTVHVVNDADAAGVGEQAHGVAAGQKGLVVVTTLGTGIGTAVLYDGVLIPNSELGHVEIDGVDIETVAANSAREREDLSWEEWAARLQKYYRHLEFLLCPDLFVVGGGISKKAHKYLPLLDVSTPIVAATLQNAAGIIGAAHLAAADA